MTAEDVGALVDKTREQMLATLREISVAAKGIEAPVVDEVKEEKFRPEAVIDSAPEKLLEPEVAQQAQQVSSRDTTEDEMEGDAVLLKRPYAGAVAQ